MSNHEVELSRMRDILPVLGRRILPKNASLRIVEYNYDIDTMEDGRTVMIECSVPSASRTDDVHYRAKERVAEEEEGRGDIDYRVTCALTQIAESIKLQMMATDLGSQAADTLDRAVEDGRIKFHQNPPSKAEETWWKFAGKKNTANWVDAMCNDIEGKSGPVYWGLGE